MNVITLTQYQSRLPHIIFIGCFIALLPILREITIVLLVFPILSFSKLFDKYTDIVAGGMSAILSTLWIVITQPTYITFEIGLASTLLIGVLSLAIFYVRVLQNEHASHLKAIRQEFEQTQMQMEAFRAALPDRAFIYDKNGYYVDVISQLIAPEVRQSLVGKHVTETPHILKSETSQEFFEIIQRAVQTGERQHFEYLAFTSKEREWRWLEGQTALINPSTSETPMVVWVARDVTERKQMEASLERVQQIANIGTWETDLNTNYVTWSDEMYNIFGISRNEFQNTVEDATSRIHPDDLIQFQEKLNQGINPYPTEYRIARPDGEIRHLFVVGEAIYDDENQVIRRVGLVQDITERKQAEYDQIQLQIARKRTSTLRHLITNVTHDLMTPITVIKTSLYILNASNQDEKLTRHIEKIENHTDILQKVAESLLMVSYLEEMDTLSQKSSDIMMLIQNLAQQYRSIISEKNQQLIVDIPDHPVMLSYDNDYMQQAISNILQNATQYTLDGGEITLQAEVNSSNLVINIEDNGIGISEEDQEHIFDRFYRAEKHRPVSGNAGLGLSISKLIIELHGGQIDVESSFGQGSCFRLQLPIVS